MTSMAQDDRLILGALALDVRRRQAVYRESPIHLSPCEFRLLGALLENAGRIVAAPRLARAVWGDDHTEDGPAPLRHVVYKLRSRLEAAGCTDPVIENRHHIGYGLLKSARR